MRPGGRLFPAWFDIYSNSERVQQVDVPVCVLHVSPINFHPGPVSPSCSDDSTTYLKGCSDLVAIPVSVSIPEQASHVLSAENQDHATALEKCARARDEQE